MSILGVSKFELFKTTWKRSFFVTLFFVFVASLLFWLDTFRIYEAEVRVLVIGKSESVAADQVVENFAELVSNLSFYERLLAQNESREDAFLGFSKDKKKELWNKLVSVKRSEKSGVLSITAKGESQEEAKQLLDDTTKTLFATVSFYYNIERDIDLRVVDDTIVRPVVEQSAWYVLLAFVSTLFITVSFFGVLSVVPLFFGSKKRSFQGASQAQVHGAEDSSRQNEVKYPTATQAPFIDPKKFIPARPTTLHFESSRETVEEKNSTERLLPGMEREELPFEFETSYPEEGEERNSEEVTVSETKEAVVTSEPVKTGEPTIEEYKRRLNELLSGGK